jgi:hypothetical protein
MHHIHLSHKIWVASQPEVKEPTQRDFLQHGGRSKRLGEGEKADVSCEG